MTLDLDKRTRERLTQACLGLTEGEAENAIAKAIILADGRLDGASVEAVTAEKQQITARAGCSSSMPVTNNWGVWVGCSY